MSGFINLDRTERAGVQRLTGAELEQQFARHLRQGGAIREEQSTVGRHRHEARWREHQARLKPFGVSTHDNRAAQHLLMLLRAESFLTAFREAETARK